MGYCWYGFETPCEDWSYPIGIAWSEIAKKCRSQYEWLWVSRWFCNQSEKKIKLINFVEFYTIGFGDKFQIGIDQVYGGVMIGSSILRNSDKMFLDSYARCNLRMFSCKKTRARANTYFQKFEVCTEFILCVLWFVKICSIYWCYQAFGKKLCSEFLENSDAVCFSGEDEVLVFQIFWSAFRMEKQLASRILIGISVRIPIE